MKYQTTSNIIFVLIIIIIVIPLSLFCTMLYEKAQTKGQSSLYERCVLTGISNNRDLSKCDSLKEKQPSIEEKIIEGKSECKCYTEEEIRNFIRFYFNDALQLNWSLDGAISDPVLEPLIKEIVNHK